MDLGFSCGPADDGCGGTLDCGPCLGFDTCGGGGIPGTCGCRKKTCEGLGYNCGVVSDGCSGVLDCGTCPGAQLCGGGGAPNVCGCVRKTCAGLGFTCGSPSDGCGGTLNCGTCTAPETCGGAGTQGVCGQGYSWTGPGCGPLLHCSFAVTTTELSGGAHPMAAEATAADCQAYCNSFSDTQCCTWTYGIGPPINCVPITDPVCKTPDPTGSSTNGWLYDPGCQLAGDTYMWGSLCNP
jgi:hypothetical protein